MPESFSFRSSRFSGRFIKKRAAETLRATAIREELQRLEIALAHRSLPRQQAHRGLHAGTKGTPGRHRVLANVPQTFIQTHRTPAATRAMVTNAVGDSADGTIGILRFGCPSLLANRNCSLRWPRHLISPMPIPKRFILMRNHCRDMPSVLAASDWFPSLRCRALPMISRSQSASRSFHRSPAVGSGGSSLDTPTTVDMSSGVISVPSLLRTKTFVTLRVRSRRDWVPVVCLMA